MVEIGANTNFHTATGKSVFDAFKNKKFLEYRRRWREYPANFIVGDFPIHLDIETSAKCNLRCIFCSTSLGNWGPGNGGFMDMGLYRKIIDEAAQNGLFSIKLSLRGEPLLHPELDKMVSYAKKKGIIDVFFNTNATLLGKEMIERLIDSGLDRISISFEGTTKEVYESYRIGARYETVVENVKSLRRVRDEKGLSYPQIRIQSLLLPELKDSLSQYVAFWDKITDEVAYLDAREEGPGADHAGVSANWACPFLWQRMVMLWDGTLLPCHMWGISDFSPMVLGNVKDTAIKGRWNCKELAKCRDMHKKGEAHKIGTCDRCSYRAKELEKLGLGKAPAKGFAK
jgi:MoaA/NifB/PqqE/SkfB family radical SAM enzyme